MSMCLGESQNECRPVPILLPLITGLVTQYKEQQLQLTWDLVHRFVVDMGYDKNEYFSISYPMRDRAGEDIWENNTIRIAVFWVVGGSEGYYVHVDRIFEDHDMLNYQLEGMLLGKFWGWDRALEATMAVQIFVNLFTY